MERGERRRPVLPCLPPGRPQLRTLPDQCQRSGGSATLPILPVRSHPRTDARADCETFAGASKDAGFAPGLIPAARKSDAPIGGRAAGILLISRAAAPPTPRAYQSALWAAGMTPGQGASAELVGAGLI